MNGDLSGTIAASAGLLHRVHDAPLLDAEREIELARAAQSGSETAFAELLCSHVRLVLAIAREFRAHGLAREDVVGEGLVGLVEATRRFDPERGVRLAAYAGWWIRAYMRRYTLHNRRIVRGPSTRAARKLLGHMRRVERALAQTRGAPPDAAAVAEALEVDVEDVERMRTVLSTRDVVAGGFGDERGFEPPDPAPSPEQLVADAEERQRRADALEHGLSMLSGRERHILRERYQGDCVESLAAVGHGLGLSRERVRQLERQAQNKLREAVAGAPVA